MLELTDRELIEVQCVCWPNGTASAVIFPNLKVKNMFLIALDRLAKSGVENTNIAYRHRDVVGMKNGYRVFLLTRSDILAHKLRGCHMEKVIFFDHGKLYVFQYGDKEPQERSESLYTIMSEKNYEKFRLEAGTEEE